MLRNDLPEMKKNYLKSLTLLEMLISIGIISLVMGAVVVALQQALSVFKTNSNKAEVARQASLAADWLVRDIHDSSLLFQANNTSLILKTASDGYVKYNFANNNLSRALLIDCNNTTYSPVSMNIAKNSFNLYYYNDSNQLITDIQNHTADVKAIGINLTTQKEGRTFRLNTVGNLIPFIPSNSWMRTLGTVNQDDFNALNTTSDGGYIFLGDTYFTSNSRDILLVKTNKLGRISGTDCTPATCWARTYGGPGQEKAGGSGAIWQTSDDGYILCGNTTSFNNTKSAGLVISINSTGDVVWAKTYGNNTTAVVLRDLYPTTDGYIFGGKRTVSGFPSYDDALLIKTNIAGNLTWARTYGVNNTTNFISTVQQTSDGGYIFGGETLTKVDALGNFTWGKAFYGGGNSVGISDLQQPASGGYVIVGCRWLSGNNGAVFMKVDATGNLTNCTNTTCWAERLSQQETVFETVEPTSDGGWIFSGSGPTNGMGGRTPLLVKSDSNGTLVVAPRFGIDIGSMDDGCGAHQTSDGGYIVGGTGNSFNEDSFFIIKTDNSGGTFNVCCNATHNESSYSFINDTITLSNVTWIPANCTLSEVNVTGSLIVNSTINETTLIFNDRCW